MRNIFRAAISLIIGGAMILSAVASVSFAEGETTSGIVINEACSDNATGITDCTGTHSDWIELYNPTAADINLAGYGMELSINVQSKNTQNPKNHIFRFSESEATLVPPKAACPLQVVEKMLQCIP